jgi:hypothetical protein
MQEVMAWFSVFFRQVGGNGCAGLLLVGIFPSALNGLRA